MAAEGVGIGVVKGAGAEEEVASIARYWWLV